MAAVRVTVKEVRGECALGLRPGDHFDARDFYILPNGKICLHALGSMLTFLYAMLKGVKPSKMGIGDDVRGYVRCPDPGPPLTCGGFRPLRAEDPRWLGWVKYQCMEQTAVPQVGLREFPLTCGGSGELSRVQGLGPLVQQHGQDP